MKFLNPFTALITFTLLIAVESNGSAGILLRAESSGWLNSGPTYHARLYVDGVQYAPNQSGLNVAVLDQNTGNVLETGLFSTYSEYSSDAAASRARFANFINGIDNGRVVMMAVHDDAMAAWIFPGDFRSDLSAILQSVGGSLTNMTNIGFRGSYALIGVKGAPVGSGVEASGTRSGSPVAVTRTLDVQVQAPVAPEPTSLAIFLAFSAGVSTIRRGRKQALHPQS